MGIYDRDYHRDNFQEGRKVSIVFPEITPIVKVLLLLNIAIFILEAAGLRDSFEQLFAVFPATLSSILQVWRYVTYQFLHAGFFHILFNMFVLYFLGPFLERSWGSVRFLLFYLCCGIAGGLFYVLLYVLNAVQLGPLVGASGSILGGIAALAVLRPNMTVMLFFILPMKIRTASICGIIFFVISIVMGSPNAGGDAAHLGGMFAGGLYTMFVTGKMRFHVSQSSGKWDQQVKSDRELQSEVDRILDKVNKNGIGSLTRKERKTLQEATKREQQRNI